MSCAIPGSGFDAATVPDPLAGENVLKSSGRGVFLINQLMDEVGFADGGREVQMRKRNVARGESYKRPRPERGATSLRQGYGGPPTCPPLARRKLQRRRKSPSDGTADGTPSAELRIYLKRRRCSKPSPCSDGPWDFRLRQASTCTRGAISAWPNASAGSTSPNSFGVDNDVVIAVALVLYVIEFVADKVPWVDSVWDAVHTVIRPIGGAVLAVATLGEASPTVKGLVALLGGALATGTHLSQGGTRAAANTSPEPFRSGR